jgi:hypothetical protein
MARLKAGLQFKGPNKREHPVGRKKPIKFYPTLGLSKSVLNGIGNIHKMLESD